MSATRLGTSTTARSSGIWITGSQGASITAASTITITDSEHEVTGSTTINTINGGQPNMGLILLKKAGATWSLGSSGNVKATAGTPATDRTVQLWTPDGNTWYAMDNSVSVAAGSSKVSVVEASGTYTVDVVEANLNMNNSGTTLAIAHGGTGQTTKAAAFDALSPTAARGDLIVRNNAATNVALATGAAGTVLTGGTDPSYSANPIVTSVTVADANNGLVSIGSNNPGIKVNSSNVLSFTATALDPVTTNSMSLGDATHVFTGVWAREEGGVYTKNTANESAVNIFSFPCTTAGDCVAFMLDIGCKATDGTDFQVGMVSYAIGAVNKAGTVTAGVILNGTQLGVGSSGTMSLTVATSVASQTVTVAATPTAGTITANSVNLAWRIRRIYETTATTFTML